jgi:predicted alpha/beta superfamily hydrolase
MSVPDSLKAHPPDPPDDDDEAREADEFARRDRIDDYTPATAIPKESRNDTRRTAGHGHRADRPGRR